MKGGPAGKHRKAFIAFTPSEPMGSATIVFYDGVFGFRGRFIASFSVTCLGYGEFAACVRNRPPMTSRRGRAYFRTGLLAVMIAYKLYAIKGKRWVACNRSEVGLRRRRRPRDADG